ncbi:MAG: alpha/beta hydrolase [Betaproteobacteria bacterium]|nr:alpha/beta hydrolase [Betaproteobacteria bacterium]
MAKFVVVAAGAVLTAWAGASFALWRWQEKLIFFPKPVPPAAAAALADLETEVRAADGVVLRGWAHPGNAAAAKTDCRLAVYFGGNNEELSAHVSAHGEKFSCPQWYVNYRGFGKSDGVPSAAALRADALAVFDAAAKTLNIGAEEACVIGRSLGSHMAAHVAANRPVKKLIMITPFDSALNVAKRRYPIFPVETLLRHPFNTLEDAPNISAPTLFLLADSDFVVPRAHTENLIARWPPQFVAEVLRLPGTTHANIIEPPEYWRAIADFMSPPE